MAQMLVTFGAFSLGVGLERGWLPGVGMPFQVWLAMGLAACALGCALRVRGFQ